MAYFSKDFIAFFKELTDNNSKEWFDLNRDRYEKEVKEPFKKFVQHLINRMAQIYPSIQDLQPKDCIFRINRDVRFSASKTPYKTMVSAVVGEGGKKNDRGRGFYFELTPDHVRVYGGIYEIGKEDLLLLREDMSQSLPELKKAYSDKQFVKVYGEIKGERNKLLPKHLKGPAEIEPLILNKQFYYFTEFTVESILDDNLDGVILAAYDSANAVESYFHKLTNH